MDERMPLERVRRACTESLPPRGRVAQAASEVKSCCFGSGADGAPRNSRAWPPLARHVRRQQLRRQSPCAMRWRRPAPRCRFIWSNFTRLQQSPS